VIEKENEVCMHTSGRNTGVLHTGVYQGMGDEKKTQMIKLGYQMWCEFIKKHKIPHRDSGQLIVAKVFIIKLIHL